MYIRHDPYLRVPEKGIAEKTANQIDSSLIDILCEYDAVLVVW